MLYRLYILVLLNHITNGMILQLGNIILQVVAAAYLTDAIYMIEFMVVLFSVCDATT